MAESILNNRSCSDSIVFLSASELSALSTDARTALYQGGARQLVVENDDTITTHVLKEDGSTVWMGSNKPVVNLLDNSDFTRPVNQREYTGGNSVAAYSYFIDRWLNQTAEARSFTLSSYGLGLQAETTLLQKTPDIPAGKVITFAVGLSNGIVATVTGTVQYNSDQSWVRFAEKTNEFGGLYLETFYNCVQVVVYNTVAIVVTWAALYEGSYSADTMPPYTPKGYAAELRECQRYYQIIHTGYPTLGTCYTTTANTANIRFPIPVPMITTPTTSAEASSIGICVDGIAPQATSLLIGGMTNTSIDMTLTFSSNYFEGKIFHVGAPFSTANIELNADS